MSALMLDFKPAVAARATGKPRKATAIACVAAMLGALAPWLLLVGAHGGLARSAATCLAGPLPV